MKKYAEEHPASGELLHTDYLVVGAGATAMSFVDTLLDETNADIVMVDRHAKPGGHWNDAYSFVRLHQPSAWYGVPSRMVEEEISRDDARDDRGATGAEVLRYFDALMRERFLPPGRVRFLSECEYSQHADGTHVVRSLTSHRTREVVVRRKLVDATLTRTEIPSTRPPAYGVSTKVSCIAPNLLPQVLDRFEYYTVVGGGKTAMDTCLFLLDSGVSSSRVRWIIPRDAWLMNRAHMHPGPGHFASSLRGFIAHYDALATHDDPDELMLDLEERGVMLRLDRGVLPQKVRGGVASRFEMERLQTITDVVRLGRVQRIEDDRIVLDYGSLDNRRNELFIDCSASAAITPCDRPVFEGNLIRLLMLIWGQPTLSASLIAHVEATVEDETERNSLCGPVVSPETISDWLPMWAATIANAGNWRRNPQVHAWIRKCRLHVPTMMAQGVDPAEPELLALLKEMGASVSAAARRLHPIPAA